MSYVEERQFTLRFEVQCPFPDDYDGEQDGYEWWPAFTALAAEVVRAAAHTITARPGWKVRPANRGRPSDEEVTLVVERLLPSPQSDPK
jgi:hypothetical protein